MVEVHVLDAGHFALDEQASEVIRLTAAFAKAPGHWIQLIGQS